MSCTTIGRRRGSALTLLWLWCRLAAVALIRPLAWEPPYALGAVLKKKKKKKSGLCKEGPGAGLSIGGCSDPCPQLPQLLPVKAQGRGVMREGTVKQNSWDSKTEQL